MSDVFCRTFDAAKNQWSPEVQVTRDPAGDWEPCVAFDAADGAWVIYDSSRGNEFNIYANRVSLDGEVGETKTLIHTDRYEGRTSAVGTPDGRGIWLTCERGNQQWGLDMRAHGGQQGLNGRKDSVLAYWDLASDQGRRDAVDRSVADPVARACAERPSPQNHGPTTRKLKPKPRSGPRRELPRLS